MNSANEDLNIEAINNGDFTTLAGIWQNGNGQVLVINQDGTTEDGQIITGVPQSDVTSKIPMQILEVDRLERHLDFIKLI